MHFSIMHLCSQNKENLFGKIVQVPNPCMENPCLPGMVYAVETDTAFFIISLDGLWIFLHDHLIVDSDTLNLGDAIRFFGAISIKYSINGNKKYYEILLNSFSQAELFTGTNTRYVFESIWGDPGGIYTSTIHNYVKIDSVLFDSRWVHMMQVQSSSFYQPIISFDTILYFESGNRFYEYDYVSFKQKQIKKVLLYDFNLSVGDSFFYEKLNSYFVVQGVNGDIQASSKYLLLRSKYYEHSYLSWKQGVGELHGDPFYRHFDARAIPYLFTTCVSDENEIIYSKNKFTCDTVQNNYCYIAGPTFQLLSDEHVYNKDNAGTDTIFMQEYLNDAVYTFSGDTDLLHIWFDSISGYFIYQPKIFKDTYHIKISAAIKNCDCSKNYVEMSIRNITTALNEIKLNINVIPNPVQSTLSIQDLEKASNISIFDITGRLHFAGMIDVNQVLPVEYLPKGMYIALITDANGSQRLRFLKD